MRKCLLFVALLVFQFTNMSAQGLFNAPDTVCIHQPIQLTSNAPFTLTNYWGFCSGYLMSNPIGNNLGFNFGFQAPSDIDIARDGSDYYGFATNFATGELIRLNYGNSLSNIPTFTNLGTLENKMPPNPTAVHIVYDDANKKWHVFVLGGTTKATSSLTRVDFGDHLTNNIPNIANMGNVFNTMDVPTGLFIQKQNGIWIGWCVNTGDNSLTYFNFFDNISYTPIPQNLGNINNSFNQPSDLAGIYDGGNWFLFATNELDNTMVRIDLGPSVDNTSPSAFNIGNPDNKLFGPTSISLTRDCDRILAFVTNGATNELTRVSMTSPFGPYIGFTFGSSMAPAQLSGPSGLSRFLRDQGQDDVYAFITNSDFSLSSVLFPHCTNSTVSSSNSYIPPVYSYDTPGLYNVYYVVDEGLPTMQVGCKQIRAMRIPDIDMSNDTAICQGDTIALLKAFSAAADTIRWRPGNSVNDSTVFVVKAFPEFTTDYNIHLIYPNGCIVDTNIFVDVKKNRADAGPDRILRDGASTILGGPYTTLYGEPYTYRWFPNQYINDTTIAYPTVNPPFDFTYYLEVTTPLNDSHTCRSIDTVVVRARCEELNMPNAFAPESSDPMSNKFGLLNKQITKLAYFRIYDRWGKLVFYTTDPTKMWDGTIDGKPANFGVYVWDADGFCNGGFRVRESGNVTLIR